MIAPSVITLLLVGLYPLLFAVSLSLQRFMLNRPQGNGTFRGLTNFLSVVNDDLFWGSLGRTLTMMVIVLIVQVVLGIGIAQLINTSRWHFLNWLVKTLLVVPIAMTPAVVGLLGVLLFNREFGFINYLLGQQVNWLGDPTMAMAAVIITDIWQWTPFAALVMLSSLTTVPPEVVEAAQLDTKRAWLVFRHVQLPYLWPGITAFLIIRTADVLKLFDMPFTLTRGGPGVSTELISLYVQRMGFRIFDMGVASAQAILLLVLCIILARSYIRFFYRAPEEA
ncbi:MAG: sugar ABC transporter permease [Anaerolineae bacterium]|nr:sugar ABC transporter permease [Anaerolineae bacterium]